MRIKPRQTSQPMPGVMQRIIGFLGSRLFFGLTLGLFALQAGWIAICARYPQAFDEQFHVGVIQLYAHHLTPFLSSQPTSADQYGAVFRDPSFFYHYLFSFPYRLLQVLTHNLTIQIVALRLINVGLFLSGLLVYRRVLRQTGASLPLIQVCLAFLALTPIMPLLAAQVNYDNLLFPVSGVCLLLTLRLVISIRSQASVSWTDAGLLLAVGIAACLIKYAFLPILAVLVVYASYTAFRYRARLQPFSTWLKRPQHWILIAGILLTALLASQRYGLNLLYYHDPIPDCAAVLNEQRCQAYSPWLRDDVYHHMHITLETKNLVTYPFVWLYHSMGELVFTISSNYNQTGTVDYHVGSQLILIEITAWTIFGIGVLLLVCYGKWLLRQPLAKLSLAVSVVYVGALMVQNFKSYTYTGIPVAIHGRYLLPVLPLLFYLVAMLVGHAVEHLQRWFPAIGLKITMTMVFGFILLFEGGGFATYILRSDPSWFWPQNNHLQHANDKVRKVLKPFVLDVDVQGTRQPN